MNSLGIMFNSIKFKMTTSAPRSLSPNRARSLSENRAEVKEESHIIGATAGFVLRDPGGGAPQIAFSREQGPSRLRLRRQFWIANIGPGGRRPPSIRQSIVSLMHEGLDPLPGSSPFCEGYCLEVDISTGYGTQPEIGAPSMTPESGM